MLHLIKLLFNHINNTRKRQIFLILVLMFITSIAEIVSIGSILPFLSVLTDSEKYFYNQKIYNSLIGLGISSPNDLILACILSLIIAAIFAAFMRLLQVFAVTRFSFAVGADFGMEIFKRALSQPYLSHINNNSSLLISGISSKVNSVINNVIMPIMVMIGSGFILLSILVLISYINYIVIVTIFSALFMVYIAIYFLVGHRIKSASLNISKHTTDSLKILQEGVGGIRDVKLNNLDYFFCNKYHQSDLLLRKSQSESIFIAQFPRYILEALAIVVMTGVSYFLIKSGVSGAELVPTLGVIALASQKIIPLMQQIYASWINIRSSKNLLIDVLSLLDKPYVKNISYEEVKFNHEINFINVSFSYGTGRSDIFKNLSLTIKKGDFVGVIGETGAGKSTLIDLLMGLVLPNDGSLTVDNVELTKYNVCAWQSHIAHVPQSIYLSDATIAENIAFGINQHQIDYDLVESVVQQSGLFDFISGLPDGLQTGVGEKGFQLSGGQRQRIGIARALYKKAQVLILDESTSALDVGTEANVIENLRLLSSGMTIIMVAHRLESLKDTDYLIKVEKGGHLSLTTYNQCA